MSYIETARDILREELNKVGKGDQETVFENGYLLLAMVSDGENDITEQDVHDVWSIVRMVNRPWHQDLIPFPELDPAVAAYDKPFLVAIKNAAKRIKEANL